MSAKFKFFPANHLLQSQSGQKEKFCFPLPSRWLKHHKLTLLVISHRFSYLFLFFFLSNIFSKPTLLIPFHEKPDTNKASRIKSQPVIEATIDVFNCSNRFQINSLNSSKFEKLSQVKCLFTSSHNLSIGLT